MGTGKMERGWLGDGGARAKLGREAEDGRGREDR